MTLIYFITIGIIVFFKIPPHWAILWGILSSLIFPTSGFFQKFGKTLSTRILQISIIFLGASLNFQVVLKEGFDGIITTLISISCLFIIGNILAKFFKIPSPLSLLMTAGTSICGGSAISALAPIVNASNVTIATALGIIFILNALSVFIFPPIAHFLNLSQQQFGIWAALAIHDTSSVVASSQIYGDEALKIGTTLKLTRALWIIPLSLIFSTIKKSENKIQIPWFIFIFLIISLFFTFFTKLNFLIPHISYISKIGLSLTLFLIGLSMNKNQIKEIGIRPVLFGSSLWIIMMMGSLFYVFYFIE
jgi:uncharacterized integral membrane protein (TIGR00698 family)